MENAIRILREIGTRPELARSYVSYARALLDAGERDRAVELLMQAKALFQEMGMTAAVTEIDTLRKS
jgi:hypothetical protein